MRITCAALLLVLLAGAAPASAARLEAGGMLLEITGRQEDTDDVRTDYGLGVDLAVRF